MGLVNTSINVSNQLQSSPLPVGVGIGVGVGLRAFSVPTHRDGLNSAGSRRLNVRLPWDITTSSLEMIRAYTTPKRLCWQHFRRLLLVLLIFSTTARAKLKRQIGLVFVKGINSYEEMEICFRLVQVGNRRNKNKNIRRSGKLFVTKCLPCRVGIECTQWRSRVHYG
ncbi:hypothetical protein M0802_012372 [Mischocyttarus mexicanus]|nr:hypothetical protein M0802_012372 [Mischocyttarus mexicanus]